MISGPVVVQVLEAENAVAAHREIMGATDPKKAAPGTVRLWQQLVCYFPF